MACFVVSQWPLDAQQPVPVFAPPNAGSVQDGNSYFLPFETAGRFQQVYAASNFALFDAPGGGFIDELVFRVDAHVGHSFVASLPSFQLNLSTTSRGPDSLSTVFAENVGFDDSIVRGPESIRLTGVGGGGVTGYSIGFNISNNPFFYDPKQGSLLIDFRIYKGLPDGGMLGVAILDAFNFVGDPIASVYGRGNPNVLTNGQVSSLGLATRFAVRPLERLRITEIRRSGDDMVLRFTSVTNKTYGVQFKAELNDPSWTALPGTVPGTSSNATWVVTGGALVSPRFYRVTATSQ